MVRRTVTKKYYSPPSPIKRLCCALCPPLSCPPTSLLLSSPCFCLRHGRGKRAGRREGGLLILSKHASSSRPLPPPSLSSQRPIFYLLVQLTIAPHWRRDERAADALTEEREDGRTDADELSPSRRLCNRVSVLVRTRTSLCAGTGRPLGFAAIGPVQLAGARWAMVPCLFPQPRFHSFLKKGHLPFIINATAELEGDGTAPPATGSFNSFAPAAGLHIPAPVRVE